MSHFEVGQKWKDQFGNLWFIYGLDLLATPKPPHFVMAFCQETLIHESFNEGGVQTQWRNKQMNEVSRLTVRVA